MPKFFFHVHNSFGHAEDDEGQEIESLTKARRLAIANARTILGEELRKGLFDLRGRIVIADAAGRVCATVPYSEAVDVKLGEAA